MAFRNVKLTSYRNGDTLDRIDEVENFHFDENADSSRMVRLFLIILILRLSVVNVLL
jgi:hypothetical protein